MVIWYPHLFFILIEYIYIHTWYSMPPTNYIYIYIIDICIYIYTLYIQYIYIQYIYIHTYIIYRYTHTHYRLFFTIIYVYIYMLYVPSSPLGQSFPRHAKTLTFGPGAWCPQDRTGDRRNFGP